jgi:hypothetical protein
LFNERSTRDRLGPGPAREASGLLAVADERLLAAYGWDEAYWSVGDEGPVEQDLVLIGHGPGGWGQARPSFGREPGEATGDGEAVARHGEYVYVLGSHFGGGNARDPRGGYVYTSDDENRVVLLVPPRA